VRLAPDESAAKQADTAAEKPVEIVFVDLSIR
jgi:hypothetical protein